MLSLKLDPGGISVMYTFTKSSEFITDHCTELRQWPGDRATTLDSTGF